MSEGMTRLSKDDGATRIEALLQFATSWCMPEKLGIAEKIKVEFLPDDDEHTFPMKTVCLNIIRLPTMHSKQTNLNKL